MKIILISDLASLGKVGDIINVKDGYAKNFLIPRKKAIFYSAINYKFFEQKKKDFEEKNKALMQDAESNKAKISGKDIIIIENASDDGRLYGSVNTNLIASKINDILGNKIISRAEILLNKPIKDIGVYNIKVDFYSGIVADVRVVVSRSESEIESIINSSQPKLEEQDS